MYLVMSELNATSLPIQQHISLPNCLEAASHCSFNPLIMDCPDPLIFSFMLINV